MQLFRVIGPVVVPERHPFLDGRTLLLLERLRPDGTGEPAQHRVAVDAIGAGAGDLVLALEEGNSARQIFGDPQAPVRHVVVGFVDEVELDGKITLRNGPRGAAARSVRGTTEPAR
jgi:microcompartment protein CcmK/EutM